MKKLWVALLSLFFLAGMLFCCLSCSFGDIKDFNDRVYNGNMQEIYDYYRNSSQELFLVNNCTTGKEIDIEFSVPVKVTSLEIIPELLIYSIEEGVVVKIILAETPDPGIKFIVDISVEDDKGKTLCVSVLLQAANNSAPAMLINELRTEYSSPRTEYIEFFMLTDGNLGGLRVFIASNNNNPVVYEFLPEDVMMGEYVVLHLRTLDNLHHADISPGARNFWVPGNTKLLRKTDAVYVLDQDDRVLCAVMISESPDTRWGRAHFEFAADFLFRQGVWTSANGGIASPLDAVSSAEIRTAATRSISRDETVTNTNTKADWYITVNGGATPGLPNNPHRFVN